MEVERIHDTTEIYFPKLGWKCVFIRSSGIPD